MTEQQIFNIVYNGLKSQDFVRSVQDGEGCRFHGENNTKCAVGFLIPDEIYESYMEKFTIIYLIVHKIVPGVIVERHDFLRTLQRLHDNSYSPAIMKERLETFAKTSNLMIPE